MATVCVHGLGYIGLPTAAILATNGHEVVGYDAADSVVEGLRSGDLRIAEPGLDALVAEALDVGSLRVADDPVPASYHLICVPTPLDGDDAADLQYVTSAGTAIAEVLRPGDTVILESTVPPGTTTDVLQPLLADDDMRAGEDFSLAYSPETVLPGNILAELRQNDRIVGTVGQTAVEPVRQLYGSFVEGEIHATDATTAEIAKLAQNTYRDVNVALANEVAMRCYDNGVDSFATIDLANAHPRVDILRPGPGVGGHCLPVDPYFLVEGREGDGLIQAARATNDGMTDHVVHVLEDLLGSLDGLAIAILGVAYKGNVDDIRRSPGLELAEALQTRGEEGATVALADPVVDDDRLALRSVSDAVSGADAAVLTANHDAFAALDPRQLVERFRRPTLVDAMGTLDLEAWRAAGFTAERL